MTAALITLVMTLALGTGLRVVQGRVRRPDPAQQGGPHLDDLEGLGLEPGTHGTVVEVTTALCSDCEATYRVLTESVAERRGVAVHQLAAKDAPTVLREWNVLQAPTTFFFDPAGSLVARVGGRASRAGVENALRGLHR